MPSALLVLLTLCLLQTAVCCRLTPGMATHQQQTPRQHPQCPSLCRCRCRDNASHMKCRKIPQFPASGVVYTTVSLARQNLTVVPANAFKNLQTSYMDLHGNKLSTGIHDDAFLDIKTLKVLILKDCGLASLPVAVTKVHTIEVLRLEHNNISIIPANSFQRNVQLVDLSLHRNRIRQIQTGAFTGLQKLQHLRLSGNAIRRIRRRQMQGLKMLKSLELSWNFITKLPGKIFKDLKYLTWLDLESNLLTKLNRNTFKGLRRLQYLNLARNPLTQIVDNTFYVVQRLGFLSLEIGSLDSISNSTFNGLGQLGTLYLGEAQHHTLPTGVFGAMGALRRLSVSNYRGTFKGFHPRMFPNDYNFSQLSIWTVPMEGCSCRTRWVRKLTKKSTYVFGYCRNNEPLGCKRKPKH